MLNHKVQFIGGLINEFLTVMRNAMSNGPPTLTFPTMAGL